MNNGQIIRYLNEAALVAVGKDIEKTERNFLLGSVGVRADGAIVRASNIHTDVPTPSAHSEWRTLRKMDYGSPYLFVARVRYLDMDWGMAKPCKHCLLAIVDKGIERVYYTVAPNKYRELKL